MYPTRIFWTLCAAVLISANALGDSLFTLAVAKQGTLASEKIARFKEGDIITVLIEEEIDASTQADLRTKKESDVESIAAAKDNTFFVANQPGGLNILNKEALPNWTVEAENETRIRGLNRRKTQLTASVSVIVIQVFTNGNILVEGRKQVTVSREDSNLLVRGIVRSKDVTRENTILSTQIVNAVVSVQGKGPLWNSTRRGLLTKLFDWFSPF